MYLLGLDVGSSSIKAAVINAQNGKTVGQAVSTDTEMEMIAHKPGWAEQDPETWWEHTKIAVKKILDKNPEIKGQIKAIGISYQMHGLVAVDANLKPLRNSIIWCDSRAVPYGDKAFEAIGADNALKNLLNSPGNFTAAKLAWVKDNEPELYSKIYKIMLPGDYIALRLTGKVYTTPSGLSEGILWNFTADNVADEVLNAFGFASSFIPEVIGSFAPAGTLLDAPAAELGITPGAVVSYRGGDQPNNAFSLKVNEPGEVAVNAGTSGVIYAIADKPVYDVHSRVNTFVHVNHTAQSPRYGVLACINGTGIQNSWLRKLLSAFTSAPVDYPAMNTLAEKVPAGSEGVVVLPFGNGAERPLQNKQLDSHIIGIDFNRHTPGHLVRATQEGIAFALYYAFEIMTDMGIVFKTIKAGNANMFLSPIFRNTFATVAGVPIELYSADGSIGAARAAGKGAGLLHNDEQLYQGLNLVSTVLPDPNTKSAIDQAYKKWKNELELKLNQ